MTSNNLESLIDKQLFNLLLDLDKYIIKGTQKQITDSIRSVTQEYQKYTITKKTKEEFEYYGLDIPDLITQSERQKYSRALKNAGRPLGKANNNSFIQIEHWYTIKKLKGHLLDWSKPLDKEEAIQYLKNFFLENTRCFFRLSDESHLQPNGSLTWDDIIQELMVPERTNFRVR
jgi:hypothetical protein